MWIDVGKLIREHVADKNGKTLPADLTSGSYQFRDLTNTGVGLLFEGKVIYDKTYGHVAYGCGTCCGYSSAYMQVFYDPLGVPFQSTAQQGVTARQQCTLTWDDVSDAFWNNWHSANTSIATVSYNATHTGVAVGSTTSNTSGYLDGHRAPNCPLTLFTPHDAVNTKPKISGPNTLWWFNGLAAGVSGYANQITLTATTGGTGTTFQWAITAGSNKVSLSTSTSATVQVTRIGQSTTANDVSITVTVGGLTSNPFNLTVRAPYTLGTESAHPTPVYLSDGTYVWQTQIYSIVLDNLLVPLPSSVNVNENWNASLVADYSGTNWRQPTPNGTGCVAISAGELGDGIFGEEASRIPAPIYNANPSGAAVQHWGQEWRIGTCNADFGPRVETNTLQKYTDHAAYTNVTTPAP